MDVCNQDYTSEGLTMAICPDRHIFPFLILARGHIRKRKILAPQETNRAKGVSELLTESEIPAGLPGRLPQRKPSGRGVRAIEFFEAREDRRQCHPGQHADER